MCDERKKDQLTSMKHFIGVKIGYKQSSVGLNLDVIPNKTVHTSETSPSLALEISSPDSISNMSHPEVSIKTSGTSEISDTLF